MFNKYILKKYNISNKINKYFCVFFPMISFSTYANNITFTNGKFDQVIALENDELEITPSENSLYLSFDLTPQWSLGFSYQGWQGKAKAKNLDLLDLSSDSWSGNLSYYQDSWSFSTSVSHSEDTINTYHGNQNQVLNLEVTNLTSLSGVIGYNWHHDNWLYDTSIGAQYSDWTIENQRFNDPLAIDKERNFSSNDDSGTNIFASLSVAHIWQQSNQKSTVLGVMILWNHSFADTSTTLNHKQSTNSKGGKSFQTSNIGDDTYGQAIAFVSFDITKALSVSVDSTYEIATEHNNVSYSASLNYSF